MSDIDDLLVRVQRRDPAGADAQSYTVELWLQGGRRVNEPAGLLLAGYREPGEHSPAALAAHGIDLFNRLFSGRLAVAFQQAWAAAAGRDRALRLRLALDPAAPELHAIPWELMYFDDSGGLQPPRPLAADPRICLSRYIESAVFDEGRPIAERPIRMLAAVSAPADIGRWGLAALDKAVEERDFHTRFSAFEASGQFRCDFLAPVSEEALHAALSTGIAPAGEGAPAAQPAPAARGYDVLLYYGHALHSDELGTRLVLEHHESGRAQLYDGDELIGAIRKLDRSHRPSMAVLVACNSAAGGALNSLAARLIIEAGVSAVLAMQRLVEISLARSFTFHLSEHLLRDGVIDVAVNAARRRVFQPDQVGWTTPVLYMRNAEGRLFSPNAQLEYVEAVLRDQSFVRWAGPEYIDVGVQAVAPGQDWNLLRFRPEDAPAAAGAIDVIDRALSLELRPRAGRRREEHEARRGTNLLALIGPPHSGQTTTLQRLTYELADAVTREAARPPALFIPLAGYEQQRGVSRLERHIIEQARAATPFLVEPLTALFRAGPAPAAGQPRFIFLLDNLDAVPEQLRRHLAGELDDLAARMPEQRFVLSSTQDSYPGQLLPRAQVLLLQPLTEQQILGYCRQRDEQSALRIFRLIRENRLLALASDPSLLALLYERLSADPEARLTRNQLVQDYLDRALANVGQRFVVGDAARETLAELAWHSRWTHREQLPLAELFRVAQQVRRERDYSLEELFSQLREARLIVGAGDGVRFVNPILHAYLTAVALVGMPDAAERVADIVSLCASPERVGWWEDVIYALAGLVADPAPLLERLAAAIRSGSSIHALIAARCLEALPLEQESRLPAALRTELIDACVLRMRSDREPIPERREQIVAALGRLNYHQVRHELRRILVEKVRQTEGGPRYEYTNVRIAAARALRSIYLAATPELSEATAPAADGPLVLSDSGDMASLADRPGAARLRPPTAQEERDEQMLVRLMEIWRKGPEGRDEFRDLMRNSPSAPERALAAFALGDLGDREERKILDAKQLLRVILSPDASAAAPASADWEDTMWAAADALTLFEPNQIIPLLTVLVSRARSIPDSAAQQLAYLAGRVRATNQEVVDWLIGLLVTNPSQAVKAKALQSLAWMGGGIPDLRLELPDGRPGPTLKQLIQDIAAWRPVRALRLGAFDVELDDGDGQGSPLYLRRKAIEALSWVGDEATIRDLSGEFLSWPLELREHWYLAAATIEGRLRGARR